MVRVAEANTLHMNIATAAPLLPLLAINPGNDSASVIR